MIIVTYHHHHRPRRPRQNSNDEDDSTDHGGDPAGSFIPIATVPWHAFFFYASNTIVHSPIDGGWSKVSSNNGLFDFTVVLLRSANGTGVGSVVEMIRTTTTMMMAHELPENAPIPLFR
jgi:hypothetical protein